MQAIKTASKLKAKMDADLLKLTAQSYAPNKPEPQRNKLLIVLRQEALNFSYHLDFFMSLQAYETMKSQPIARMIKVFTERLGNEFRSLIGLHQLGHEIPPIHQ